MKDSLSCVVVTINIKSVPIAFMYRISPVLRPRTDGLVGLVVALLSHSPGRLVQLIVDFNLDEILMESNFLPRCNGGRLTTE